MKRPFGTGTCGCVGIATLHSEGVHIIKAREVRKIIDSRVTFDEIRDRSQDGRNLHVQYGIHLQQVHFHCHVSLPQGTPPKKLTYPLKIIGCSKMHFPFEMVPFSGDMLILMGGVIDVNENTFIVRPNMITPRIQLTWLAMEKSHHESRCISY